MLLKKKGFPEEDEFVLCTVTAVHTNSVFCTLDEYGNRTALIHISEIAPGRIRNIRDYVKEGKKVVCKVLQINEEKGHIDLSLRRVSDVQKREKLNQVKQEQLAEKIVEFYARQNKKNVEDVYKKISDVLFQKYGGLYSAFEDVALREVSLESLGIEPSLAKDLTELIKSRIKPPEIKVEGELKLSSYAPDGVEVVKKLLIQLPKEITVSYKGAGSYRLVVESTDYKSAEKILKNGSAKALELAKSSKVFAEFTKLEA